MSATLVAALAILALVAATRANSTRHRRVLVAEIRSRWGKPTLRDRDMHAIAGYHRSLAAETRDHMVLDQRTWDDLDLDEVFAALDRTESTVGQQVLYHRMRTAPCPGHLEAFEALVNRITADPPERERAQSALTWLRDPAGYDLWWIARPEATDRRAWHVLYPIWTAVLVAAFAAAPFWPGALLIPIAGTVANLIIRIRTAWRVGAVIGPFRQLGALLTAAERLQPLHERPTAPITGALLTDLPCLGRLRTFVGLVSRDPMSGDVVSSLWEIVNTIFLVDVNVFYFASGELRRRSEALVRVAAAVGDVDAAIAVASFRAGAETWTRPRFVGPATSTTLTEIRHPLLEDAVPNSIRLGPPHGVLVTGSNMSGKSTFLRTVGVTAVMAQSINTCLATAYEAPVLVIRTCIGRSDDLLAGKSYYQVEVDAVLARVKASGGPAPHLFLFDELFRGTNAVERIAAGEAVLRELIGEGASPKPHIVLAATHDAELVELLQDRYQSYHFADAIGPEGLTFHYRLQPGPASTRNAIALLQLHGAPTSLVHRAMTRAAELDRQRGSWSEPQR